MNTKTLALTIVFAAVTVALNPAFTNIAFPAPYAIFLYYQIWEIPIVAAFLIGGPKTGVFISILNTVVLLAVFPGASPTGPFYITRKGTELHVSVWDKNSSAFNSAWNHIPCGVHDRCKLCFSPLPAANRLLLS